MKKLVEKYLRKRKERVIFEINISNYNKKNYYIALVYNDKIDLYKIVYIPLDMVEDKKIAEYVCYQFVDMMNVEILLDLLNDASEYRGERDLSNKKTKLYQIAINMNLLGKKHQFKITRYLPRKWEFLFDVIVTMFGYVPHIASGLCEDILTLYRDISYNIPYQEIVEFELLRGSDEELDKLFPGKKLDYKKIKYLENVNDRYYSIIDGHIVIIGYDKSGVLSTYCDAKEYMDYVYTVLWAIRDEVCKEFSKIEVVDRSMPNSRRYYLCYDVTKNGLMVIRCHYGYTVNKKMYQEGQVKFLSDVNGFEDKIKDA